MSNPTPKDHERARELCRCFLCLYRVAASLQTCGRARKTAQAFADERDRIYAKADEAVGRLLGEARRGDPILIAGAKGGEVVAHAIRGVDV